MDDKTTIAELKRLAKDYRDERDWEQFHDPKNLAEDISIEAAELLEHFLWKDKAQVAEYLADASNKAEIADELADVIHAALLMSVQTGIDISDVFKTKMEKNAKKYPIEKARGKATKYDKL